MRWETIWNEVYRKGMNRVLYQVSYVGAILGSHFVTSVLAPSRCTSPARGKGEKRKRARCNVPLREGLQGRKQQSPHTLREDAKGFGMIEGVAWNRYVGAKAPTP